MSSFDADFNAYRGPQTLTALAYRGAMRALEARLPRHYATGIRHREPEGSFDPKALQVGVAKRLMLKSTQR
jgi:hypothetical protein